MNLRKEIQETLCFYKNEKYNVLSRKLVNIDKNLLENIIKTTYFLNDYNPKIIDRIRYILQEKTCINTCLNCKTPIIDINKTFCSPKCNNNSEQTKNKFREKYNNLSTDEKLERKNKRTNTFNIKYGGYTLQSPELREKVKTTLIKKYGVDHPFKNDSIKRKIINTWLTKYGVDNPFKAQIIKEKIKDILIEKYGVENPGQIYDEHKNEKTKKTKIERGLIIPDEFLSDYKIYSKKVKKITETIYKKYKNILNPYNYERVVNGKKGFQLDHRYSIFEGFLNNVEPEIIGHIENLQMIKWEDNRSKSKKCDIDLIELKNRIKLYENRKTIS
jgi:hypothetical protein